MASPKKTLLVEHISYAEEALKQLKAQLHTLFKDIETEYDRVLEELQRLEENETKVKEETFERVDQILQNAWTKTMSVRTRLQDLDDDLHNLDNIMAEAVEKLRSR